MMFLPFPYYADRGEVLEETWRHNVRPAFEKTFKDLRASEAAGWRPSLVFSPMFVEDGRRLLISNLDLDFLTYSQGHCVGNNPGDPPQLTDHLFSRGSFEFARTFPGRWDDFPVRTAARLSASFPFVSTAAVLPTRPRRRVVDAGYFDNYGVNIAAGWLVNLLDTTPQWLVDNVSGIALVQIRDGVSRLSGRKDDFAYGPTPGSIGRGMEEVTGPITGLFAAREAVPMFRNDEQVEALSALFADRFDSDFFTSATFEFGGEASLSWYLTGQEKAAIREHARRLGDVGPGNPCRTMPNLVEWWTRHV